MSKRSIGSALALFCAVLAIWLAAMLPVRAEATWPMKFTGATGGILRFPNTNQAADSKDAFGEAWIKPELEIYRNGDTHVNAFFLGNYVRDSEQYSYNNTRKGGFGLSLSTRVGQHLDLIFSARYDMFRELDTGLRQHGWRFAIDYYYYRYFEQKAPATLFGMPKRGSAFKSWGTLEAPGSLAKGDHNIVLTMGGEYSAEYGIGDSKFLFVPFVDANFAWDKDGNNYNNKIIPAVGIKIRRPIDKGEIFAGVKYEVDYRWVDHTVDTGPILSVGWYKGF